MSYIVYVRNKDKMTQIAAMETADIEEIENYAHRFYVNVENIAWPLTNLAWKGEKEGDTYFIVALPKGLRFEVPHKYLPKTEIEFNATDYAVIKERLPEVLEEANSLVQKLDELIQRAREVIKHG